MFQDPDIEGLEADFNTCEFPQPKLFGVKINALLT
jgi:hypothetical protein